MQSPEGRGRQDSATAPSWVKHRAKCLLAGKADWAAAEMEQEEEEGAPVPLPKGCLETPLVWVHPSPAGAESWALLSRGRKGGVHVSISGMLLPPTRISRHQPSYCCAKTFI